MTHLKEEGNTESEVTPVNREETGEDTKAVQKDTYEGEAKVDEVVGKVIKRIKSYDISFQLGVVISNEEMK